MTNSARTTPRADAVMFGIAAAVLFDLALWAMTVLGELFFAGESASPVPPPGSAWLVGVRGFIAIVLGALITHRRIRQDHPSKEGRVFGVIVLVGVFILGGSTYAYAKVHESRYLNTLGITTNTDGVLRAGHMACEWLAAQHWGGRQSMSVATGGRYRSTNAIYGDYVDELDAQPGPITADRNMQAVVAFAAWNALCPFQQWVHRPIVGNGGD
jgi:hypothetical protein